jgi:hypothetical protein
VVLAQVWRLQSLLEARRKAEEQNLKKITTGFDGAVIDCRLQAQGGHSARRGPANASFDGSNPGNTQTGNIKTGNIKTGNIKIGPSAAPSSSGHAVASSSGRRYETVAGSSIIRLI